MKERNHRKRSGQIMNPEGKIVKFDCITDFALENGLSPTHITQILNGDRFTYRGWQAVPEQLFELKYHDGAIHKFKSLMLFCKKHDLDVTVLPGVLSGKRPHYKYWVLPSRPIIKPPKPKETKWHSIKSPKGEIYTFNNICDFCRQHKLERTGINKLVLGSQNKARGWTRI